MTDTSPPNSPGRLVARCLAGSWRIDPPDSNISETELTLIAPMLLESGAASLGWWSIRHSGLNGCEAALQLKSAYQLHTLQAAVHRTEIEEVIALLNSAGVEPVLVKGWSVARLYPEEGLRPYGDIDLCFAPDQYQKATEVLGSPAAAGYNVDVHEGFTKLDDLNRDELMARSEPARLGAASFRVLGLEDQFRILCTHLFRHSAWRPMWLCDIAAALESRPASFDWARCLGDDKLVADWVACAIGLAYQLLDATVDDTPVAARAKQLPRWLIPDVLKNWNQPFPELYPPMAYVQPFTAYLRQRRGLLKAIRTRWPDPIEATIRLRGPFNEMPRLPFQIGNALWRIMRFLTRTQ